jgi:hypothetical protein
VATLPGTPEVPSAPPAVKLAAYLVPLCVLPSSIWRIVGPVRTGVPQGCPAVLGPWEPVYIATLSAVSFGAALLTLGLVHRWGVVFPAWVPWVGGRIVPARPVVAVASAGAVLIWFVYAWAVLNPIFEWYQPRSDACVDPAQRPGADVAVASYAPLLLWAPLLTIVIVDYRRRRNAAERRLVERR